MTFADRVRSINAPCIFRGSTLRTETRPCCGPVKVFHCLKRRQEVWHTRCKSCEFRQPDIAEEAANFQGQIIVIMPVRDEGAWAVRTVRNLRASKAPRTALHFCVIDDGSTDGCCDILRRNNPYDITVIRSKGGPKENGPHGQGVCRTLAVEMFPYADGYYSIDAHETMDTKHGIETLVLDAQRTRGIVMARSRNLANDQNVGVGCRWHVTGRGRGLRFKGMWNREPKTDGYLEPVTVLAGADYAFTRDTYEQLGGWGESYGYYGWFDLDMSINAKFLGIPIHCNPRVTAGHLYRGPRPYKQSGRWRWWGYVECLRQRFRPEIWRKIFQPAAEMIAQKLDDPMMRYLMYSRRFDAIQAAYEPRKVVTDEEVLEWMGVRV